MPFHMVAGYTRGSSFVPGRLVWTPARPPKPAARAVCHDCAAEEHEDGEEHEDESVTSGPGRPCDGCGAESVDPHREAPSALMKGTRLILRVRRAP